jgi:sirohydrochlorin ferrochelatase
MRILLVVAHGSRRSEANAEVERFAADLRRRAADRFDRIAVGYLELAAPPFTEALDDLLAAGASEIVVYPHLLAAGAHVTRDVPEIVASRRGAHPAVTIRIAPHLGRSTGLATLVLDLVDGGAGDAA